MDKNDRDYSNGEITVHWRPSKCIHSTICYSRLRSVFDPSRRPWIKLDKGTTEEIIDIVSQCPTDALTYTRNKKADEEVKEEIKESTAKTEEKQQKELDNAPTKEPATRVQIMKDGPVLISGDFVLKDIHGVKISTANTVALCRCGRSSTQPFCDGTHNRIGFKENR